MPSTFTKDPQAKLDYSVRWTTWLGADTISTSTWTVPEGITKDSDSHANGIATAWLSGGTAGENYSVVNRIVTTGGRTDERTITIRVREK